MLPRGLPVRRHLEHRGVGAEGVLELCLAPLRPVRAQGVGPNEVAAAAAALERDEDVLDGRPAPEREACRERPWRESAPERLEVGDRVGVDGPGAGDGARDGVEDSSGAPFRQVVGRACRTVAIERARAVLVGERTVRARHDERRLDAGAARHQIICSAVGEQLGHPVLGRRPVAFIERDDRREPHLQESGDEAVQLILAPAADVSLLLKARNLRAPVALICAERAVKL